MAGCARASALVDAVARDRVDDVLVAREELHQQHLEHVWSMHGEARRRLRLRQRREARGEAEAEA